MGCPAPTWANDLKHIFWIAPLLAGLLLAWAIARSPAGQWPQMPAFTQPEVDSDLHGLTEKFASRASASLAGQVVDTSGGPIADAVVVARSGEQAQWTRSDEQGRFVLHSLPPGKAQVSAWLLGKLPAGLEVQLPSQDLSVVLAESEYQAGSAMPSSKSRALTGRVESCTRDGSLGARHEVLLIPRAPVNELQSAVLATTMTSEAGEFQFDKLALGSYQVVVLPEWARGGSWPDLTAPAAQFLECSELEPSTLTIPLACGSVLASLADEEGEPVEGALIVIRPAGAPGKVWPTTSTGPDGRFEFRELPAGKYELDLRAGEGSILALPVEIFAGEVSQPDLPAIVVRKRS